MECQTLFSPQFSLWADVYLNYQKKMAVDFSVGNQLRFDFQMVVYTLVNSNAAMFK